MHATMPSEKYASRALCEARLAGLGYRKIGKDEYTTGNKYARIEKSVRGGRQHTIRFGLSVK